MFNNPTASLEQLNLQWYEILPVEPLHAVTGHIKNVLEEIPYHLKGKEKDDFEDFKKASFKGKELKNGSDHRESLVNLCLAILENMPNFPFYKLLRTLCEIQVILYQNESDRTVTSILRLYNVTFQHMMLMYKQLSIPEHLTPQKFLSQYFHSLVAHAPRQYRIINGMSANTEKEERLFCDLKKITKFTSNHHPNHVIYNNLIRLQVKNADTNNKFKSSQYRQNQISKINSILKDKQPLTDSIFTFR